MKLFTKGFLLLLVMSAMFVKCKCGGTDPTPTIVKSIIEQISHEWVLSSATKNGADAGFDLTTFTLALRESNKVASSFTIVVGSAPATPSPGGDSGDWAMNATFTQITFLPGTSNENVVTVVSASEESLVIKWVDSLDKTDPEYTFTFTKK